MTNAQVIGLGASIVLGMAVHGALTRGTHVVPQAQAAQSAQPARPAGPDPSVEIERLRTNSAELQVLLNRGKASALVVGDRTLVVTTDWKEKDGDLSIEEQYYEYVDGRLVRVPRVEPDAK